MAWSLYRGRFFVSAVRGVVIVSFAVFPTGFVGERAQAATHRYTQGDAEEMLRTYPATDEVYTRLAQELTEHGLDIRPFQESYGDVPYCVDDWHVLALAAWEGEFTAIDPPITFTRNDAWTILTGLKATFSLDGVPVDLRATPITAIHSTFALSTFEPLLEALLGLDITVGKLWGFQWGRTVPPGQLTVGEHTFSANVTWSDGSPYFTEAVTFQVSGPDSTACGGA